MFIHDRLTFCNVMHNCHLNTPKFGKTKNSTLSFVRIHMFTETQNQNVPSTIKAKIMPINKNTYLSRSTPGRSAAIRAITPIRYM